MPCQPRIRRSSNSPYIEFNNRHSASEKPVRETNQPEINSAFATITFAFTSFIFSMKICEFMKSSGVLTDNKNRSRNKQEAENNLSEARGR